MSIRSTVEINVIDDSIKMRYAKIGDSDFHE